MKPRCLPASLVAGTRTLCTPSAPKSASEASDRTVAASASAPAFLSDDRIRVDASYNRWLQLVPACIAGVGIGTYASVPAVLGPFVCRAQGVVAQAPTDFAMSDFLPIAVSMPLVARRTEPDTCARDHRPTGAGLSRTTPSPSTLALTFPGGGCGGGDSCQSVGAVRAPPTGLCVLLPLPVGSVRPVCTRRQRPQPPPLRRELRVPRRAGLLLRLPATAALPRVHLVPGPTRPRGTHACSTQCHPGSTQCHPGSTLWHAGSTQGHPGSTQGHPGSTQCHPLPSTGPGSTGQS